MSSVAKGASLAHLVALSEAATNLTSSLCCQLGTGNLRTTNNPKSKLAALVVTLPVSKWGEVFEAIRSSNASIERVEFRKKDKNGSSNDDAAEMLVQVCLPDDTEKGLLSASQLLSECGNEVRLLIEGRHVESDHSAVAQHQQWFPRSIPDLDIVANRVLLLDQMNDVDHPSMQDEQYQARRKMFTQLAFDYKHDQPIPLVEYTDEENRTWSTVFNRLCDLYDELACKEFLENFKQLREIGLYRSDRIPQLRDVSDFVKRRSGFTLRPVAGYLSARDFLSALALRVFCCTQYIRHSDRPFYTPEPDCCHELLGHVPMLADAAFAHFSQEIGLASLGASDEDVKKLATCYFFTVEFGFCKEAGKLKVYGAGLLACVDEFQHAVSDCATIREFEPALVLQQECKVTSFQDMYFYTNSFAEAKDKLRHFASTLRRNHTLLYNPYTQSVEIAMDASSEAVKRLIDRICWDLQLAAQVAEDFNI